MTRPTWVGVYEQGELLAETLFKDKGLARAGAYSMLLFYYAEGADSAVVGDCLAEYCPNQGRRL